MATYSFKSVGKTTEQTNSESLSQSSLPIGIKTPLQLSNKDGLFAMSYSLAEQIPDNLRNLLLTNWGERLGLYDFGANLQPITTEMASQDDFDSEAMINIKNAVAKWMPYVNLDDYTSEVDRTNVKNTAVIHITISYSVPALEITNKSLQVTLYAI